MKGKTKQIKLAVLIMALLVFMVQPVFARTEVPIKDRVFTPKVLTQKVTTRTTELQIYVFDDTTLYIKNGSKTVAKKAYEREGLKTVKIAKQKAGSKLNIYLVYKHSGKKGSVVTRKVASLPKVSNEVYSSALKKPAVQKTITNQTNKVSVALTKGMTLIIKNDAGLVKSVKYEKTGTQTISIAVQKEGTNLYFYGKKGSKRTSFITRKVEDVVAPKTPSVKVSSGNLLVKGEIGTKVYVKTGSSGWVYRGVILGKDGLRVTIQTPAQGKTSYQIRLRDSAGNWSKSANISVENNSGDMPSDN